MARRRGSYNPTADERRREAARRHRNPYGPGTYRPPEPPAGSFDPALDAQRRAATRGLGDLEQDIGTAGTRDTVDYGLGREDILRSQTRGNEDIDRRVAELHRGFQRLGGQQRQSFQATGLAFGGASLQAAAKRKVNEAFERAPLDVARTRLGEDTSQQLGRLALDLAPPDASNPLGGRRFQDRTTQLTRAQREDQSFGLDIGAEKAFQATQAGWVPPSGSPAHTAFEEYRRRTYGAAGRFARRARPRPGLYGTVGTPRYGANF